MIDFSISYSKEDFTWSMLASAGDIGYGIGWLETRPTKKMVRKFKQTAHKSINPYVAK